MIITGIEYFRALPAVNRQVELFVKSYCLLRRFLKAFELGITPTETLQLSINQSFDKGNSTDSLTSNQAKFCEHNMI